MLHVCTARACSDNPRAWELLNTQFYVYVFYQRFKMKEKKIPTKNVRHSTLVLSMFVYASKVKIVRWKKEKSFPWRELSKNQVYGSHSLMVAKCCHGQKFSSHSLAHTVSTSNTFCMSQNALDLAQLQSERCFLFWLLVNSFPLYEYL